MYEVIHYMFLTLADGGLYCNMTNLIIILLVDIVKVSRASYWPELERKD